MNTLRKITTREACEIPHGRPTRTDLLSRRSPCLFATTLRFEYAQKDSQMHADIRRKQLHIITDIEIYWTVCLPSAI
jgi:hypothetical protein